MLPRWKRRVTQDTETTDISPLTAKMNILLRIVRQNILLSMTNGQIKKKQNRKNM